MQHRSWPVQAGLAALWGLSFLFLRGLVASFGWAPSAVLLCLVVGVGTGANQWLGGERPRLRVPAPPVLILAVAVAAQNVGITLAIDQLGVALGAIVLGAMPLFATLTGQVWGVDRITGRAAVGLAVGFLGLLLVVAFPAHGDSWAFIAGVLAGLLGALAAAFATRYIALRLGGSASAYAGASLLAAVFTLPVVLVAGRSGSGTLGGFLTLVLVALLAGAVGPLFGTRLPDGRPGRETLIKTGGTLIATVAGIVIAGERLSGAQLVGMLLMLGGTLIVLELVPARLVARWRR